MSLTLYTKRCLSCTDKLSWKRLKSFAKDNGFSIVEKRTSIEANRLEAEQYGVDAPFVVNGSIALSLSEPLERLLN